MTKWLLSLVFIVRVTIPLGVKETYEVKRYEQFKDFWQLTLTNNKTVIVPVMWTVIEEK